MTPTDRPKRACSICGNTISAEPASFHPDGCDDQGRYRFAHLSCANTLKAARLAREERLTAMAGEMLEALKGLIHTAPCMLDDGWDSYNDAKQAARDVIRRVEGTS